MSEPSLTELLASQMKVDSNIRAEFDAFELMTARTKVAVADAAPLDLAPVIHGPADFAPTEALAGLYPDTNEDTENGKPIGENGNLQGGQSGNEEPPEPKGQEDQTIQTVVEGAGTSGVLTEAAPKPPKAPKAPAAAAEAPKSPWEVDDATQ